MFKCYLGKPFGLPSEDPPSLYIEHKNKKSLWITDDGGVFFYIKDTNIEEDDSIAWCVEVSYPLTKLVINHYIKSGQWYTFDDSSRELVNQIRKSILGEK